jgi:transcriptional regulator with XRE-family HTH domain
MPENRIDLDRLVGALERQRQRQKLSWRQLAHGAGVSPSTMTRMQQGKLPDINTFAALTQWLGLPAEEFLMSKKSAKSSERDIFGVASGLLRGRKNISQDAAEAMEDLLRAAQRLAKELK